MSMTPQLGTSPSQGQGHHTSLPSNSKGWPRMLGDPGTPLWHQVAGTEARGLVWTQLRQLKVCWCPAGYLGVDGRREYRGDSKQAVVENNLLQCVVAHGPHHHHVTVPLVAETLGVCCSLHPADRLTAPSFPASWGVTASSLYKGDPKTDLQDYFPVKGPMGQGARGPCAACSQVPCPRPGRPLSPAPG